MVVGGHSHSGSVIEYQLARHNDSGIKPQLARHSVSCGGIQRQLIGLHSVPIDMRGSAFGDDVTVADCAWLAVALAATAAVVRERAAAVGTAV